MANARVKGKVREERELREDRWMEMRQERWR